MRLICQEVDALAVLQLYKFSDERLLTGVSLNYRPRPSAVMRAFTIDTCLMVECGSPAIVVVIFAVIIESSK